MLITGATRGLGKALADEMAGRGWRVLVHGRKAVGGDALIAELLAAGAAEARYYHADFGSLAEIAAMCDAIAACEDRLDLLVNNAGLGVLPERRNSADGHELVWQVNYLSNFLLIERLLPLLERGEDPLVINISSAGQYPLDLDGTASRAAWSGFAAYGRSKLAQIMLAFALGGSERPGRTRINAIHPASLMDTRMTAELGQIEVRGLIGRLIRWRLRPRTTVDRGVRAVMRLLDDPKLRSLSGTYVRGDAPAKAHAQAYDPELRRRLLDHSRRQCAPFLVEAVPDLPK